MKIALIGSAPSSVNIAPFQDQKFDRWLGGKPVPQSPPSLFIEDDWQIWGCSPGAWAVVPRSDRWFEVHRWEPGKPWFSPEYTQFLREYRGIVYTGGPIPEITNHVVYPIERVEAEFSAYFLHSSLSLMMGVAILEIEDARKARVEASRSAGHEFPDLAAHQEDDVIGMWGVDMSANEEYGDQKSGCQFFILEAMRRGIQVYVPPESCVMRPKPIYGLSEWNHDYIKCTQRARELNMRKEAAQQQITMAQAQLQFLNGAIDDMTYFINTWTNPYGIPSGLYVSQKPGSGLGGGITLPRPDMPGNGTIHETCTSEIGKSPTPDDLSVELDAISKGRVPKQILYGGGVGGGKTAKQKIKAAIKKAKPRK